MEAVVAIVLMVVILYVAAKVSGKSIERSEKIYRDALAALKADPANPEKKERALTVGRAYSKLTTDKHGFSLFDEATLMNDVSAACAGAAPGLPTEAASIE